MKNSKKLIVAAVLAAIICIAGCQKKSEPVAPAGETAVKTCPPGCTKPCCAAKNAEANAPAAAVIEQTTCPVMAGAINKDLFVEYQGKKVYFCCPDCKGKFEKEPEKYLDKLPQFQK